ncbi:MAG TPA: hypothetical protein VHO01_17145 [Jatrophihabitans sp.]|nr:hypothetical protein [Jatrophihabitans sp.]
MPRHITTWRLFQMRPTTIVLVLLTELAAVTWTVLSRSPITGSDLGLGALLLSLCIAHSVYLQRSEGVRHMLSRPRIASLSDMLGTWTFPAAVLLPVPLAVLLVIIASVFQWPIRNFDSRAVVYRYVYSQAAVVLGVCVVHLIVTRPGPYAALVLGAAAAYLVVGPVLICCAVIASSTFSDGWKFLTSSNQSNELITVGIGLCEIIMWRLGIPLLWLSLPAVIGIQRWALRSESSRKIDNALPTVMTEKVWSTVAREVIRACTTASVIRVDTDDPAAARSIAQMQAGCDALGAVGASGLAVLLADCPGTNAESLALRLRSALASGGVTASVAVAAKPRDGQVLEDLLAVAEAELITRDAATRSAKSLRPEA